MPIIEIRPDSDGIPSGWSPVGAPTIFECLSDDLDATYARSDPLTEFFSGFEVTMGDLPSLPDGVKIVAVRLRWRIKGEGAGNVNYRGRITFGGTNQHVFDRTRHVNDPIATFTEAWRTVQPGPSGGEWTIAAVNDLFFEGEAKIPAGGTSARARMLEVWYDVDYNERPAAAYTGPTGVLTDTSQPTITWDYTDPEHDPQQAFRVVVREDDANGALVHDSGWISSAATQHQLPTLDNDATYWSRVEVRQAWSGAGTHGSDPDDANAAGSFTLDLVTADAPTFAATPEHDEARVRLDLDDPGVSPTPEAEWYLVEFRDDPAHVWTVVRGADAVPADNPVTVYDYEAPFGRTRAYRATAFIEVDGLTIGSPRAFADATLDPGVPGVWWITDVLDPDRFHDPVCIVSTGRPRTWQGREVVHRPAGMDLAVVESEPPTRGDEISLTAWDRPCPPEEAASEHDRIAAMVGSTRTLLLRDRREHLYFRWVGDRVRTQLGPESQRADRFDLTSVEVARPQT